MTDLTSKPDHGRQLVDSEGRARSALQLYLDDISLVFNEDRTSLKPYTVGTAPDPASGYGMIFITDESGGPVPAFSDLTNWRRCTDRAVIS